MDELVYPALEATLSSDQKQRSDAVTFLEKTASTHYKEFIESLVNIFKNDSFSQYIRSTAGLYFKNMLISRSSVLQKIYINKWLSLDENFREKIKNTILCVLGTEKYKPGVCSQIVSALSYPEYSNRRWPELMPKLTQNITKETDINLREASIETIGFICQDLPPNMLINYSSDLLNNIVFCMKKEECDRIRLVSTKALLNSLDFIYKNFEVESQRNLIMQYACESCLATDISLKVVGLQCLCKIVSLYYQYMERYMNQALFSITFEAMKSNENEVVLQAIEFWSSLCEEEQLIMDEISENVDQGTTLKNYALKALPYILPCLLEHLYKDRGEWEDDDDWTPPKASSVCISLLASVCGNEIIPHLLPFIGQNYNSQSPFHRNACALVLGALMDGPSEEKLQMIILEAHPIVLALCKDPVSIIRDSAFWALGNVYENMVNLASDSTLTLSALRVSFFALKDVPAVATNACWASNWIIKSIFKTSPHTEDCRCSTSYISNEYKSILEGVYTTIKRNDISGTSLIPAAFELFNTLVECHPFDTHFTVMNHFSIVIEDANIIFAPKANVSPLISQYQSFYCIAIQTYIRIMQEIEIQQLAEMILYRLIEYLKLPQSSTVLEDVILTFGVLVQHSPHKLIIEHLHSYMTFLMEFLKNSQDVNVCSASATVIGDVCTVANRNVEPYVNNIMHSVFQHLLNPSLDFNLKGFLVSLIGDISMAIGSQFSIYLSNTLELLKSATSIECTADEDDEYAQSVEDLRSSCLTTYTSVIQSMYHDNALSNEDLQIWGPHISHILRVIETISSQASTDVTLRNSCGLLGDLFNMFRIHVPINLNLEPYHALVERATNSPAPRTQNIGFWLKKLLSSSV